MKRTMAILIGLALLAASACKGGDSGEGGSDEQGVRDGDAGVEPDGGQAGPLYAIMYEVYDDESSNSYLSVLDSLDLDALDPSQDREFAGGRAFLATFEGAVFIGSPDEPRVTRYTVDDRGGLIEGASISFANYGVHTGSLDAWNVNFIRSDKAYLFNFEEGNTLIWDPSEMEIVGEIPAPDELVPQEGWAISGSPGLVRGNRLFRSLHTEDYDSYGYSQDSLLAIYDIDDDSLLEVVPQTRCPALGGLAHEDEAGNLYFGNWIWPVAGSILYDWADTCVLRIQPGADRFDDDWQLTYTDLFEGRQGAQFSYVAGGQALVAVFNEDETSFDAETDPWEYAGRDVWGVWRVDLESREKIEIDIPRSSGAFTPVRLDGREFLLVPSENWDATDLYEVIGERAEHKLHIPGWSYQFVKIR